MPAEIDRIREIFDEIYRKSVGDSNFAKRVKANPEAILKEHGLTQHDIDSTPPLFPGCETIATNLSKRVEKIIE